MAVVSNGSAVLGLGDIEARAALPVMEGKSVLFKEFAGLDSVPIVLGTSDVDEIVSTIVHMAPSFAAINLEDISAPRCFEIEQRLIERLDIPFMHDDQHGTAVVVLAALINAAMVVDRDLARMRVVVSGSGAAGVAITRFLLDAGVKDIVVIDSMGTVDEKRDYLPPVKKKLASETNPNGLSGGPEMALEGADVFIGVSGVQTAEKHIASMTDDAIIFALANPDPEVAPQVAHRYAKIVATGRSDYPNQINNVLAFPGHFKGALDSSASRITASMRLAATHAISSLVGDELSDGSIVPNALDERVSPAVAVAVAAAVD